MSIAVTCCLRGQYHAGMDAYVLKRHLGRQYRITPLVPARLVTRVLVEQGT